MAKKPNQSDGGSPNELDAGFDTIERIGRRAATRSAEDRAERQRIQGANETANALQELIKNNPEAAESSTIEKAIKNAVNTRSRIAPRIRLRNETRVERATEEARNAIERQFSKRAINGLSNELSAGTDAQNSALSMMNGSSRSLENSRKDLMGQLGGLETSSLGMADNMFDREGRPNNDAMAQLRANYRKRNLIGQRLGVISAAERMKRANGEDSESITKGLFKEGRKAERVLEGTALESELKSGKGLGAFNMDQLKQKETDAAIKLVEALDKLKDSAGKSAEEMDKLQEGALKASEDLTKVQAAIGAGGGKGNTGNRILQGAPAFLNAVAAGAQEVFLNQPLQVLQNKQGFAQLNNSLYDMRKSALAGNMQELMMSSSGTFSAAQAEGDSAKNISRGVTGAGAVASGVTGILGGLAAWRTGGMTGVGDAVTGAVNTGVQASDLIRGATAQSYNLNFQQSNIGLNRATTQVTADMRQNLYDYSAGLRRASLAGGGASRSFQAMYGSDYGSQMMMPQLEAARIGTGQFAQFAEQGFNQQGSVFNANSIFQARNLERAGMGDMSTNMSRLGTLAGAGANNPQAGLQSVMEAAFSKSLDSSKALNMMVENTAAMVQQSQGNQTGVVDTTGAASSILAGLVNKDNPNQEMAAQRAASVEQRQNTINSGIGRNFADMAGVAAISQQTGVSNVTAINLKKLDDPTVAALRQEAQHLQAGGSAQDIAAFRTKLIEGGQGLGGYTTKTGVNFSGLLKGFDLRNQSNFRESGVLGVAAGDAGFNELASGKLGIDELRKNPKYQKLYQDISTAAALPGSEMSLQEFMRSGKGLNSAESAVGKAAYADTISGKNITATQKAQDDLATAANQEMTKQARLAAQELGGFTAAISKINEATKSLSDKLSDKTADDFRGSAAKAAERFNNGAETFVGGVKEFGQIVDKLNNRPSGLSTDNKETKR